jgi:hypothetical protein
MKARSMFQMLHDLLTSYMVRTGMLLCALPLSVDKLDSVPEAQRSLYVEHEGKFRLDVEGLEDNSGLKSALQKERDAVKEAKRVAKEIEERYVGIDPAKVREMMSKLDQDGEAALIAAGKIDEVIAKRTEKFKTETQRRIDEAVANATAAAGRAKKFEQRVLDNHIRQAATKAGLHQHAIEDALFRARSMFSLSEDGDAIQLGTDGAPVLGKDGKTPFSPVEWLEGMKETAPHWFPASSSGGGAGGGKGTPGGNGKDLSHLPPAARMAAARERQAKH